MSENNIFNKPSLSNAHIIELLKERGLVFEDEENEIYDLQHIGYFRLTGYLKFFQDKETNTFAEGTTFKQVFDLYIFDRKLRLLTLDAIEKIEISLKANISDYMSEQFGCFWYLDKKNFYLKYEWQEKIYEKLLLKIQEKQEQSSAIFVKEYFRKYDEKYLPSWMLFEELTLGEISNIYKIIGREFKRKVAKEYGVFYKDLIIWIQLLVFIRNISAHHSRLWNKEYIITLRSKDKVLGSKFIRNEESQVIPNFYNTTLVINHLLVHINKDFGWLNDLEKLFDEYSSVSKAKMGFNENWKKNFEQ